jgi:hypothetical protein
MRRSTHQSNAKLHGKSGRRVHEQATTATHGALSARIPRHRPETSMNDDTFNLSIRQFLKMVGVNSQREIEHAVAAAIQSATLSGNESLPARMTLEIEGVQLRVVFDGVIELG